MSIMKTSIMEMSRMKKRRKEDEYNEEKKEGR